MHCVIPKLRFWHRAVVAALTILGFNRFGQPTKSVYLNVVFLPMQPISTPPDCMSWFTGTGQKAG